MAGYIEDRWYKQGPADPDTGRPTRVATDRYGKGKRWRVKGIPGVRDRSFTKESAAKAWLKQAGHESTTGDFYDPRDGNITLREYVEDTWWPHLRKPPGTKESMRSRIFKHILPHMGHFPLNRIGSDEIKWWLTQAEQDLDAGTLVPTWAHFSSIMQAAHRAKRIPANPFRDPDLEKPQPPESKAKAWPRATVDAVRAALSPRYRILVDLGMAAGLRQGEAFGFSPDDIDGDEIRVQRQVVKVGGQLAFKLPKGDKERTTVCPPELAEAVKAHMREFEAVYVTLPWIDAARPNMPMDQRPKVTVRLLVTTIRTEGKSGGAVNRSTFDEKQWKPALVKAGLMGAPEVTVIPRDGQRPLRRVEWEMPREDGFHVTRHTFASIVLQAGETVAQLAAWLGHSDPAFTLRTYVHFLPRSGKMGMKALGAWLAPDADDAPAGGADVATETP
jgi:integrase